MLAPLPTCRSCDWACRCSRLRYAPAGSIENPGPYRPIIQDEADLLVRAVTDERVLFRCMLAGDERAFDAFFEAHFPRLYRFALPRLGGDVEAAQEVVQASLGKAMRKLD